MTDSARLVTDDVVEAEIGRRARQDQGFRALLARDPRAAVESLGITVPDGVMLHVEGAPAGGRLVIYDSAGRELTDSDLEQVAGGAADAACEFDLPVLASIEI